MSPADTLTGEQVSESSPTDFDWAVRARIYTTFAATGRAPAVAEVAASVGSTEFQIQAALARLCDAHEVALLPNGRGVLMANPFSAVPTDYLVETPEMTYYANCAWDALGIPAILGTDGWTRTHCAQSGDVLEFGIKGGALQSSDGVVHLVTPVRDAWIDIGFT